MVDKRSFNKYCLLLLISQIVSAGPLAHPPLPMPNHATALGQEESRVSLPDLIYNSSEHFSSIESANLGGLLERIGNARVVLLGEASHGTSEFYEMRARITRELIENKGFNIIAVEGDWPDVSRIDFHIRGSDGERPMYITKPFTMFPRWMWLNESMRDFSGWLKQYNSTVHSADDIVSIYGLDIYNLFGSIDVVLDYLYSIDSPLADSASRHYSCLAPWSEYPPDYGHFLKRGQARPCVNEVNTVLHMLLDNITKLQQLNKERYFTALQSARLVVNGECYFRTRQDDDTDAWNQRDRNMFETLLAVMDYHGKSSKAVVWAHNSHIGDSRATEMQERGEVNLGQLVRESFGDNSYVIGFGMDHGLVAAASKWDAPVEIKRVPHAHKQSYEHLFHQVKTDNFLLPLRHPVPDMLIKKLQHERLERAIGSMYDPNNELDKHYYLSSLPREFDEYIFFDRTHAVKPSYLKR